MPIIFHFSNNFESWKYVVKVYTNVSTPFQTTTGFNNDRNSSVGTQNQNENTKQTFGFFEERGMLFTLILFTQFSLFTT